MMICWEILFLGVLCCFQLNSVVWLTRLTRRFHKGFDKIKSSIRQVFNIIDENLLKRVNLIGLLHLFLLFLASYMLFYQVLFGI